MMTGTGTRALAAKDRNVITRTILALVWQPGYVEGQGTTYGLHGALYIMNPLAVSLAVLACVFGGGLVGLLLRSRMPAVHILA